MRLVFKINDVDNIGFDAEKSAQRYRKGDLIDILDDMQYAGKMVEPSSPDYDSTFVIVNVPDITREQARNYTKKLRHLIDWEILASTNEGWRLKVYDTGVGTLANINKSQVENFITKFNGVIISFAANSVVFDIGIFGAATSNGFWGRDVSGVLFEEITHNADGYRIRATLPSAWTDTQEKRQKIQSIIIGRGCEIVNVDIIGSRVTYDVPRDAAIKDFKEYVRDTLDNRIIRKAQYYIDATEVDTIITAGGEVTITKTVLLNKIKNKLG